MHLTNQLIKWKNCVVQQDIIEPHQHYEQLNFQKKLAFLWPWSILLSTIFSQTAQNKNFAIKFRQNLLYQHFQPLYDVMQEETENFQFVQVVNFEEIDSLKNNGEYSVKLKYFLPFNDSIEEFCKSRAFVGIANARKCRGSSTINIEQNSFHQSRPGRSPKALTLFFSNLPVRSCKSVGLVHS